MLTFASSAFWLSTTGMLAHLTGATSFPSSVFLFTNTSFVSLAHLFIPTAITSVFVVSRAGLVSLAHLASATALTSSAFLFTNTAFVSLACLVSSLWHLIYGVPFIYTVYYIFTVIFFLKKCNFSNGMNPPLLVFFF